MDIQVIVIVGDRSITEEDDIEWENICKDEAIITTTVILTPHGEICTIFETKAKVQSCLEKLIPEYLNKLTKSSDGG